MVLWVVAMVCTVAGLVSVLRARIVGGGLLIVGGLAVGLLSTEYLP